MDILISSNLERLLFLTAGPEATARYMTELSENGKYTVSDHVMKTITETFSGYCCDEAQTALVIKKTFEENGYLADTHTAVAIGCLESYRRQTGDNTLTVIASTASPYKFAGDVCKSLGHPVLSDDPEVILNKLEEISGTKAPAPLRSTLTLPTRFTKIIEPSYMADFVFEG